VVVPCGKGSTGLPFGIQIIGRLHHDAFLSEVAVTLEAVFEKEDELRRPRPDFGRLEEQAISLEPNNLNP